MKVKKVVGICLKPLHSRVMPQNMSKKANNILTPAVIFLRLTDSEVSEGTQRLSTIFGLAQTMPTDHSAAIPLARVGARSYSTPRVFCYMQHTRETCQLSCTSIGATQEAVFCAAICAREFCTLALFMYYVNSLCSNHILYLWHKIITLYTTNF